MKIFLNRNFRACRQGFSGVLAGICMLLSAMVCAQPASSQGGVITVRAGDTFSSIAARYSGDPASWRQFYNPRLSGLKNPNRLSVGMQLEMVSDPAHGRYLRLASPTGKTAESVAASTTPASPAKPESPPGVPAAAAGTATRDDALTIGIVPNISAAALQGQYENLKRYLERLGNGQKVRLVIPANFKSFFDSTMRGDYDLAIAAPNLARVAQIDRNLIPLVGYEPRIAANMVTLAEGGIATPRDVQGKPLAFANPQSLVAMYGQQWMASEFKLEPGRDYEVKGARTDLGVGRMMLTGEAVAAIMSQGELRALPAEEAARMKVVEVFARIPNFIVLAHPRLGREQTARLRTQLKSFLADPADGAAFARATGLTGIVDVDPAVLRELDPYVAGTRKIMGY
ncbi:MAG: PhnD/SsuA/transferrin family substrate-binding protein [Candidatus Accumulibacter sp.]|nr:PhnD/SsuA/transferrin family substrate-binding protein [Accumulibacter sp.]